MSHEMGMLNIVPRPEKIFRDEKANKNENLSLSFSGELVNENKKTNERMKKKLCVFDKSTNTEIGQIYFNETTDSLGIKLTAVDYKYKGSEVGLKLYKELIKLAGSKGLRSIKSDCIVQGGAIVDWKKLQDEGYEIIVNPKVEKEYEEMVKVYNEGKYFKNDLLVPENESVFELSLQNLEDKKSKEILRQEKETTDKLYEKDTRG